MFIFHIYLYDAIAFFRVLKQKSIIFLKKFFPPSEGLGIRFPGRDRGYG